MTARILDVTEDQYHADPCVRPSLSHSIAQVLVEQSPRHAWLSHPRLGGKARKSTRAMDDGSIMHRLLLGKGKDFEMVMHDSWRTNASKDDRAAIIEAGKIPILAKDFEQLATASERVAKNCADQGFPLFNEEQEVEMAIEFTEGETLCRCRLDLARADHVLYDLKKVASANPVDIERHAVEYGYDLQQIAYSRAYEQLHADAAGRTDFVFLCFEIEPPYEVVPIRLDGILREIGSRRWNKALTLWQRLFDEGTYPWPGYADGAVTITAPLWVMRQELPEDAIA